MEKPVLVIMAAGMGSRYGGLKQIDPADKEGHIIMDFSIYDAVEAGFERVVFIIKRENEALFREAIGNRIEQYVEVDYVFQELENIPEGFVIPEGRVKPWGTGHAILSCLSAVSGPFAVINADDYYGKTAFSTIYQFLSTHEDGKKYHYAMVGYLLKNTITENGYVARGICRIDEKGSLVDITERTRIELHNGEIAYTEDDGNSYVPVSGESIVSMNLFGFSGSMLLELKKRFPAFLEKGLKENPLKCEYFLPSVVAELLAEGKAAVSVLKSQDRWHGVTYKEDKPVLMAAIQKLKDKGLYPQNLWEE